MQTIETKLEELLVTKAPVQLPANARKTLADNLHWLTLIGGVLTAWAAWNLYQLAAWVTGLTSATMPLYAYATPYRNTGLEFLTWLGIAMLAIEAIMYFIAFPALKARKKSGWNLLFYVALLNVAYSIVYFFADMNFGSLLFSLLATLVGMYLLFQIRSSYLGTSSVKASSAPKTPTDAKS